MEMKRVAILAMVAAAVWWVASAGVAAETDPSKAGRAQQLVRQLGSASFQAREQATRELAKLGIAAAPALREGATSDDAEIRVRCRRILIAVIEADTKARLDAFVADTGGLHKHDLPGWEQFRKTVGTDRTARALFVAIHRAEPDLMRAMEEGPKVLGAAVNARCQSVYESIRPPGVRTQAPLGTIAALFFASAQKDVKLLDQTRTYFHQVFALERSLQTAITSGPTKPAMRLLVGAWIERTHGADDPFRSLALAIRYELPQGLLPALVVVENKDASVIQLRYGALAIARFGERKHIARLEPLLKNVANLPVRVGGEQLTLQVHDVALAAIMHLEGQDPREFGFSRLQPNAPTLFMIDSLGFLNEDERKATRKKWETWKASRR